MNISKITTYNFNTNFKAKIPTPPNEEIIQDYKKLGNKAFREELLKQIDAKTPLCKIGELYNISTKKLLRYFKIFGIETTKQKKRKILEQTIPQMIKDGYTIKRMSKETGLSVRQIDWWLLRQYGCTLREVRKRENMRNPKKRNTEYMEQEARIKMLREQGYKPKEIAKMTNYKYTSVNHYLDKLNLRGIDAIFLREKMDKYIPVMLKHRFTMEEMKKEFKCSGEKIREYIKNRFGISYQQLKHELTRNYYKTIQKYNL